MSTFNFDYELIFTDTFDQSVIDISSIPNKSGDLVSLVQQEVSKIQTILTLYPGVNIMSSFTTYDSVVYKITVKTL
jgi:hypothetical protein